MPVSHSSYHYIDVIVGATVSQITSPTIDYSTVYSGADQRKHQNSMSLAFVRGIHRWIPAEMDSKAENVSIWWRHHGKSNRGLSTLHLITAVPTMDYYCRVRRTACPSTWNWPLRHYALTCCKVVIVHAQDVYLWISNHMFANKWKLSHDVIWLTST